MGMVGEGLILFNDWYIVMDMSTPNDTQNQSSISTPSPLPTLTPRSQAILATASQAAQAIGLMGNQSTPVPVDPPPAVLPPIVPVYDDLMLVSPYGIYPYPGHFLLPNAATCAQLGQRYGGTPVQVKDPRLQFKQGLWIILPNTSWWLQMPDGTGVECDMLANYWTHMGQDHPETADLYCKQGIANARAQGQKIPQ